VNHRIHNIYKAMQGRELTHTQYLKKESEDKTKTYTIFTKLFRGVNHRIHNIYKTIQGIELTHTQYLHIYKSIQWRELTHTRIFTNFSGERTNTYHTIYKPIKGR